MPQTATIKKPPAAFRTMKATQAEGVEWGADDRQGARWAVAELLRGRMDQLIDLHLECMAEFGGADRRNGGYRRHLLTELGDIELAAPRTLQRAQGGAGHHAIERRFVEVLADAPARWAPSRTAPDSPGNIHRSLCGL